MPIEIRALAPADVAEALAALGIARCHLFVQRGNDAALASRRGADWTERSDLVMMSRTPWRAGE
jgi:hypothetical protein